MTCCPPTLTGPRQSEYHVAVRLGDLRHDTGWTITLDGEDVTDLCTEAIAGDNGMVELLIRHTTGPRRDRLVIHCDHVAVEHRHGRVAIARTPRR